MLNTNNEKMPDILFCRVGLCVSHKYTVSSECYEKQKKRSQIIEWNQRRNESRRNVVRVYDEIRKRVRARKNAANETETRRKIDGRLPCRSGRGSCEPFTRRRRCTHTLALQSLVIDDDSSSPQSPDELWG